MNIPGKNWPYYFAAIALFFGLKFSYTLAGTDDLGFLLNPTDALVSTITGADSRYVMGEGYFYENFNIILGRTCSGFNFWILCFIMLSFLGLRFCESRRNKLLTIPVSFTIAYVFTILANACRIVLSIFGQRVGDFFIAPRPHHLLHEAIGFFMYLLFLITIYLLSDQLLKKLKTPNAKPA